MQQRLNDPRWRSRSSLCALLCLIPGFGHHGFLFMGKKSGRKQLTTLGILYGIGNFLALALIIGCVVVDEGKYILYDGYPQLYFDIAAGVDTVRGYGWLALAVIWIACGIHTLCLSGQYLRYLALWQVRQQPRHPLVFQKQFRRENLWWMWLSLLPFYYGFSLWFAGCRMKRRSLSAAGAGSVLLATVFFAGIGFVDDLAAQWETYVYFALVAGGLMILFLLGIGTILACWYNREDYLDFRAKQYQDDTHKNPRLADPRWRRSNSLWHIWTALPYVGGIGIALAGLKGKRRKNVLLGVGLSLLNAALLIGHTVLVNNFNAVYEYYRENLPLYASINIIPRLLFPVFLVTAFAGMAVHWENLKGRAEALQGYASEFEREADLYRRMAARSAAAPQVQPVQQPVVPQPVVSQPAVSQPVIPQPAPRPVEIPVGNAEPPKKLDINHCTQADYMDLPGFTVAMAHRAMEYRAARGGFRSGDEFVEALEIKPHFAVQIFDRITVEAAAPAPVSRPDSGAARRRIEF